MNHFTGRYELIPQISKFFIFRLHGVIILTVLLSYFNIIIEFAKQN